MHSISIVTGNITSTGFAASQEAQGNSQSAYTRGAFSVNRIAQKQCNNQDQAAILDLATDVGGTTPEPDTPNPPPCFSLPSIFVSTKTLKAQSGVGNEQDQALCQDAVVDRGTVYSSASGAAIDAQEGSGPLAKNEGCQCQGSNQKANSDIAVRTKVGDAQCEKPQEPDLPPPDPTVIVDDTQSTAVTANDQNQESGQNALVKPQIIYDDRNGQNNTDPAINELGQGQHATKETKAKNQTEISVAPGGWYDPWRVGVGPTTIQATRTLAGAQSSNIQSQAYAQNATAHSGLVAEYADNTGSSRQTNGSDTDARNKVSVLYRTNANAPMSTTVVDHTAIAEDTNDQSHYGSQVASSVGAFGRSRNSAGTLQTNGQLVRSDMRVLIDV